MASSPSSSLSRQLLWYSPAAISAAVVAAFVYYQERPGRHEEGIVSAAAAAAAGLPSEVNPVAKATRKAAGACPIGRPPVNPREGNGAQGHNNQ